MGAAMYFALQMTTLVACKSMIVMTRIFVVSFGDGGEHKMRWVRRGQQDEGARWVARKKGGR